MIEGYRQTTIKISSGKEAIAIEGMLCLVEEQKLPSSFLADSSDYQHPPSIAVKIARSHCQELAFNTLASWIEKSKLEPVVFRVEWDKSVAERCKILYIGKTNPLIPEEIYLLFTEEKHLTSVQANPMTPEENAQDAIGFVRKYHNCPYPKETVEDRIAAAIMQDFLNNDRIKFRAEAIDEDSFNDVLETWRIIVRELLNEDR